MLVDQNFSHFPPEDKIVYQTSDKNGKKKTSGSDVMTISWNLQYRWVNICVCECNISMSRDFHSLGIFVSKTATNADTKCFSNNGKPRLSESRLSIGQCPRYLSLEARIRITWNFFSPPLQTWTSKRSKSWPNASAQRDWVLVLYHKVNGQLENMNIFAKNFAEVM